jgi:hypothetical protein
VNIAGDSVRGKVNQPGNSLPAQFLQPHLITSVTQFILLFGYSGKMLLRDWRDSARMPQREGDAFHQEGIVLWFTTK